MSSNITIRQIEGAKKTLEYYRDYYEQKDTPVLSTLLFAEVPTMGDRIINALDMATEKTEPVLVEGKTCFVSISRHHTEIWMRYDTKKKEICNISSTILAELVGDYMNQCHFA